MSNRTGITQDQLTALRHALARLIGEGWSHTPDPGHTWLNTHLKGPDGAVIEVAASPSNHGSILIGGWSENYGQVPRYEQDKATMPSIQVSYGRGAEVIFREMQRRFLPGFWAALKAADQYIVTRNEWRGKTGQTFAAIRDAFGAAARRNTQNEDGGGMIHAGTADTASIDVRVNSADSAEFSVKYLNRERAVKLAAFLSTL